VGRQVQNPELGSGFQLPAYFTKLLNEFREDLVSGEWVLFATGRAKRGGTVLEDFKAIEPEKSCPFEDLEKSGNIVLETYYNKEKTDWIAKAAENKFPAVLEGQPELLKRTGPFSVMEAKGRHEVIIFKDHKRTLSEFSPAELADVFKIYQERYISMLNYGSMEYILIFHNQGPKAGATMQHPHSQIISIPILPPDIKRSIMGSERFFRENNQKVYDVMIDWEIKEKKRIIYADDDFIAFCPFVSKVPYEIRIFPKKGHAHFEQTPEEILPCLGKAMHAVFAKMDKALNKPDYNFFIHTAPLEAGHAHDFYTWHIEILPQLTILGGFDLGSGIDVNTVDPDEAAALMKKEKAD